ncbi:MAG TPA: hypothetical protein VFH90_01230 [Candidatus Limnocylindria bacterium]|nr:hypothetical protein [Candidatus Limnocylindria bacterium]
MRSLLLAAVLLAGCADPSPSPSASAHADHDPQLDRVKAALTAAFGMTFEPAGPHHEIGRAPDGIELDLVGVPVEEIVLSVPGIEPELGITYLPHLRDLLPGPGPVWEWIEGGFTCRRLEAACEPMISRGNLTARFTEGDPSYLVLVVARR